MSATTQAAAMFGATPRIDTPETAALFERVAAEFAAPLARLASSYEADVSLAQDLLQEVYLAIWRSLPAFAGRCSLRTWVYRVSHNAAATYVLRRKRRVAKNLVNLDDLEIPSHDPGVDEVVDEARMLARMRELVERLKPIDRQVFVLYLEGLTVDDIAEISGLSHANTGTKLHRIRKLLSAQLATGEMP